MSRKAFPKIPHILVSLQMSVSACRDKLRGVVAYERLHGPWQIHLTNERLGEQRIRKWDGTGIIADSVPFLSTHEELQASGLPVVLLDYLMTTPPLKKYGIVRSDGRAVGRLGAEYFLSKGLKSFAFVNEVNMKNWSVARQEGFQERLMEAGQSCNVRPPLSKKENRDWNAEIPKLTQWIQSLPKPVGIMAAMDVRARQVLEVCYLAGIHVPNEVLVLGVDNDELVCQTTYPSLSSIQNDNEQGGFLAAQLLDEMIHGKCRKPRTLYYQPLRVVERRSTEYLQTNDELVLEALEYIQLHASSGLNVLDVVKNLNVSRRTLEQKFKKSLHHTVLQEIHSVLLRHVTSLLLDTDLSITEIARLSGCKNEYYLSTMFSRQIGKTMSQFRADRGG